MNIKSFSPQRLKEARNEMTRRELLIALANSGVKVTEITIWRWENGKALPPVDKLAAVANILKKPIEYFFEAA